MMECKAALLEAKGNLDEGEVVGSELVVPGRDAPEVLELADQPFDQVALPVALAVEVGIARLVDPVRDDRDDLFAVQHVEQPSG